MWLEQELTNAARGPIPTCVNNVVLKTAAQTMHLHIVCACVCAALSGQRSYTTDPTAPSLLTYCLALYRKSLLTPVQRI